jgi:hypothetical protein
MGRKLEKERVLNRGGSNEEISIGVEDGVER